MAARGGARTGAGRPKGVIGVKRKLDAEQMAKADEAIRAVVPGAFDGDAYLFLAGIYKNPDVPLPVRMKAAETAIAYERPKLQAIEHSGDAENPLTVVHDILGDLDGLSRSLPNAKGKDKGEAGGPAMAS